MVIAERVKRIISCQLKLSIDDEERLLPGASFINDLGGDSLKLVELQRELEDDFEIEIPDEDAKKISTVGEAITYVEKRIDERFSGGLDFIEPLDGRINLKMIALPSGMFKMGANDYLHHRPAHFVQLSSFHIGKYPVTRNQWEAVTGEISAYYDDNEDDDDGDRPVETVWWEGAVEFCEKLSKQTGRNYRLPTEAEWEYACRAGSKGKYFFGNDNALLKQYAWYWENSGLKSHPVGGKLPNDWGLHDMYGNVWEWCQDIWHDDYNGAPSNGSAWLSGGDPNNRVLRGGGYNYYDGSSLIRQHRSLELNYLRPDDKPSNIESRDKGIGFRLVCAP